MKIIAFPRTEQGTGASRRLRIAGLTPGIVYGGTAEPKMIQLDHNALYHALRREAFHSSILDMEIEGKTEQVLLRDYQMHAFKQLVLHVDFQRVDASQPVHVKVPLHFLNADVSPAVKQSGGAVHHALSEIEVTCLPANLPEYIEVDLSGIQAGQTVHLSDLKLPVGVTAKGEPSQAIATATAAAASAAEDEAGEQPAAE